MGGCKFQIENIEWKSEGKQEQQLNTVQFFFARSKTCLHPQWVCRKLPLTLKNIQKTSKPAVARAITNYAFMPADVDTVNIHVLV